MEDRRNEEKEKSSHPAKHGARLQSQNTGGQGKKTRHTHKRLKLQEKRSALRMLPTELFPWHSQTLYKIIHREHMRCCFFPFGTNCPVLRLLPFSTEENRLPFPLSFTVITWCFPVCRSWEPSHGRTQACLSCPKALLAAFCSDILAHAERQVWTCQEQPGTQRDKTVC